MNPLTSKVFQYLGIDSLDFSISFKDGGYVLDRYDSPIPQPTEQEIIDTAASQAFLDWEAENGGDPTLTARRIVKEALDDPAGKLLVALVKVLIDQNVIAATPQQVRNAIVAKIAAGEAD